MTTHAEFALRTGLAALAVAAMAVVAGAGRAPAAEGRPHVVLICVDDLRPELGCYGVEHVSSPNIDRLAETGRMFRRHFVQAPTCGASRYVLLTGRYGPSRNTALFRRAARIRDGSEAVSLSWPHALRTAYGYETVAVGKVSHHPGGRGGTNWDDAGRLEMPLSWDHSLMPVGPWRTPRGAMHGLAFGQARDDARPGVMAVAQAVPAEDTDFPDGLVAEEALAQLDRLAADATPFFLAVGFIRPHLPFGCPRSYFEAYRDVDFPAPAHTAKPSGRTTWHGSGEFRQYDDGGRDPRDDPDFAADLRRHYAACVSYADAQVGKLLDRLEALGLDDETIVVLWGDHGWHLGEHAIWGKHCLFDEALRAPLIVRVPGMADAGVATDRVVETADIRDAIMSYVDPDRGDAARGPAPAPPRGLGDALREPGHSGGRAFSDYARAQTLRDADWRYVGHDDGYAELYDHRDGSLGGEVRNVAADHPELVAAYAARVDALGRLRHRHAARQAAAD